MHRRSFLNTGLGLLMTSQVSAADSDRQFDAAAAVLRSAVDQGLLHAAVFYVKHDGQTHTRSFGAAESIDSIFLLASISKPICMAALMTLYDEGELRLIDPVQKYIPEFRGHSRDEIRVQELLTHTSGLPDQLPENESLRKRHAPLSEFVERAIQTPLLFAPRTKYSYSSMGILLAAEISRRITGMEYAKTVEERIFRPLGMEHSALGLGSIDLDDTVRCQVRSAAPESGGGDASTSDWDWNSPYWRNLGSPWGGAHGSAPDIAKFLSAFLVPSGTILKPETCRLMVRNHNPPGLTARGLGFSVGRGFSSIDCSERTFGHTGSTGTLAWADPATNTICIVLTTLPAAAANPHPRRLVSDQVARIVKA